MIYIHIYRKAGNDVVLNLVLKSDFRTFLSKRSVHVPDDGINDLTWSKGSMSSSQQKGGNDCGVFVLMVCYFAVFSPLIEFRNVNNI